MYNIKLPLVFVFTLVALSVFGQKKDSSSNHGPQAAPRQNVADIGSVSGKVTDAKGSPVGYATVTLLRMDSSVVNGDLTKDNGSFTITPTGVGKFKLRIESIGVTTKYISVELTPTAPDKDLGKIKLAPSENTLNTVNIVGEKPIMELKVDKKVFNVEKNITSAGGSATDVLQNVPAVSVDADGNVSLRGKSDVTILIDGKPATMLGTDVASALQSLPAGSIENVEVITNPSAKYDAQGTSGIINIVTKKDGRFGMNGTATLGAGTKDKYNGNFGINAHKGKWNVFANGSFRLNNTFNDVTTDINDLRGGDTIYKNSHSFEHVPRHFNGSFNSIGATYEPDKYNSLTVTENLNFMQFGFKDYSDKTVTDYTTIGSPYTQQYRYSDFTVNLLALSSALDYKHKFRKKDEELNFDFTFANTNITRSQYYRTDTNSNLLFPLIENAPATGQNRTLNVWADYTDPLFTSNGKLGLGFKSQVFWFMSSGNPVLTYTENTTTGAQGTRVDSPLIGDYQYSTQIHAGYINWSDQLGKFSYQAGLRVEDAVYKGSGSIPKDTTFSNSFTNFFPSAFVSYKLSEQSSIYLNYSRRTNRPDFRSMLPFKDLSNPGTVNMGNPSLIPEFINNVEFSYSKATKRGDNFILSAYYSYTENLTQRVSRRITAADSSIGLTQEIGQLLSQPLNIAHGTTYGMEGTGHVQIFKWWDATLNVNFFQNDLVIGKIDSSYSSYLTNTNGFTWFGKVNTSIKLPKSFSIQINVNYESPKVVAQGNLAETWWMDVAVRKNIWKNKATLILNCSDVFNTHRFLTTYSLPAYYETINRVKETRIGNITFTYRFGKQDLGKGNKQRSMRGDDKNIKPTEKDRDSNLRDSEDNDQGGGGGGGQKPGGGKN